MDLIRENNKVPLLGYLSPDGVMFKCEYYGHCSLAEKLVNKLYPEVRIKGIKDTDDNILGQNGWVVIKSGFIGIDYDTCIHSRVLKMTDKQVAWLISKSKWFNRQQLSMLNMYLRLEGDI